jgi:hypothetical protein
MDAVGYSQGLKQQVRDINYLPPHSAEVKK